MKIIVTGSLGHISKPLTIELLQNGNNVTVVSSNAARQEEIRSLGANAAIGSLEDVAFLKTTFEGADAAYCMIPFTGLTQGEQDLNSQIRKVTSNYVEAIKAAGLKRIVFLSSIGAHLSKGNGIIQIYHEVEAMLNQLNDVSITFMRPTSFYYNLYAFVPMIRQGFMAANYGEDKVVWVSPSDIAARIAAEFKSEPVKRKIVYVASDERTGKEVAGVLGAAIGQPGMQWKLISDEEVQKGLEAAGLPESFAAGLMEMQACMRSGKFWEDYKLNRPELGPTKLEEFAKEFAARFASTAGNTNH